MASTTPCSPRNDLRAAAPLIGRWRAIVRRWCAVGCALLLVLATAQASADAIVARAAWLEPLEDAWAVSADFEITLSTPIEDALSKGITLFFVLETEVNRSRWYWFDQRVAGSSQTYRLSYNILTRQYRLSAGTLFQNFATLDEALAVLGRVRRRPVLPLAGLSRGNSYSAAVRMRLDLTQLPRPFQASPFASREWNLVADWYRFTVSP